MHALALGAKWAIRGASGSAAATSDASAASKPSSRKSDASASMPAPLAALARKVRREFKLTIMFSVLISRHHFVQVEQHTRQGHGGSGVDQVGVVRFGKADQFRRCVAIGRRQRSGPVLSTQRALPAYVNSETPAGCRG